MKKLLLLTTIVFLSCNETNVKDQPVIVDSTIEIIDTLDNNLDSIPLNIDSLNEARKRSRDSIKNSNSGK